MKTVYFNQKGFEIQEKELRQEVYQNIKKIGHYNVTSKYYNFLNKKNLSEIQDGEFRVSLSSFGKKYILFLIKINDRRYSILINKKNEIMVTCQYKFHQSLYDGTLLDGELVKNENNKWIFIVNDIPTVLKLLFFIIDKLVNLLEFKCDIKGIFNIFEI